MHAYTYNIEQVLSRCMYIYIYINIHMYRYRFMHVCEVDYNPQYFSAPVSCGQRRKIPVHPFTLQARQDTMEPIHLKLEMHM